MEGDDNGPTIRTKSGIPCQSIADDNILDKYVSIKSNTARSATRTMVRKTTLNLRLYPRDKRTKLAPHALKCIFLNYGIDGNFVYCLWDLENQKLIRVVT